MNESVTKEISLFTFLVIGYGLLYFLNNVLTNSLYVVPGAHLVHLPSGLKILLVLVTGLTGSFAIAVVGFLWSSFYMFKENYLLSFVLAVSSGLIPWISLWIFQKKFELHTDLSNLTWKKLLLLVLIFAVLNSTCLQFLVYAFGQSTDLLNGIWVMLVGDLTGIFIVIYFFRFAIKIKAAIALAEENNPLQH